MHNLVENHTKHKKNEKDDEEKKPRPVIKSATDLQRLKLEKLMKNPDKPVIIPESPREKDYMQTVPSFVRNVMGSSAGAGSGEFHVYRHLRRKEYARQKCIHAKSTREQLDDEYKSKLEKNRLESESKTAKKRAKRLKKKQNAKKPKPPQNDCNEPVKSEDDDDSDEDENILEKDNVSEEKEIGPTQVSQSGDMEETDDVEQLCDTEQTPSSPNQDKNEKTVENKDTDVKLDSKLDEAAGNTLEEEVGNKESTSEELPK